MTANKLIFKGGYGEHGRSCFLIEHSNGYVMIDCGIMDSAPNPYPEIDTDILKKVSHIFITHCHKDHCGALHHFIKNGFAGTVITSSATYELTGITYENCKLLDYHKGSLSLDSTIQIEYGSSGHCVGSLWFRISFDNKTYFFSGDYQEDTLAHICDTYNENDDIAVIDLAHKANPFCAQERRDIFLSTIMDNVNKGKKVLIPVQKYGFGIEILYQLKTQAKNISIMWDDDFFNNTTRALNFSQYFKEKALETLNKTLNTRKTNNEWNVFLLGDQHIEKQDNIDFINSIIHNTKIILVGRIKKDTILESWYKEGIAIKLSYPHHPNEKDIESLITRNSFKTIFPFHNNEKEVIIKS